MSKRNVFENMETGFAVWSVILQESEVHDGHLKY